MKPTVTLQLVASDCYGQPFLIMSIRDAIAREVADFLDLVPAKSDALHLLMGAVENGFTIHDRRTDSAPHVSRRTRRLLERVSAVGDGLGP